MKKKGKDTMMRSKVEGRGGGMRGECPVACEKWGSDASREATSRRGVGVGEKGLISTASPIRVFQLRVAVLSYIQDSLPVYNCKENILKHYIEANRESITKCLVFAENDACFTTEHYRIKQSNSIIG